MSFKDIKAGWAFARMCSRKRSGDAEPLGIVVPVSRHLLAEGDPDDVAALMEVHAGKVARRCVMRRMKRECEV